MTRPAASDPEHDPVAGAEPARRNARRSTAEEVTDPTADAAAGPAADAAAFAALFRAIYLTYHRRDGPRSGLTAASRAVLGHLTHTGPLTIGEAALHLDRAQSVVSEIVDGLEGRGC